MLWRGEHKHCDTNVAMPAFFRHNRPILSYSLYLFSWPIWPRSNLQVALYRHRKALQWVSQTTQNIIATHPQSISDISEVRCLHTAQRTLKDNTHPSHSLFILLPSGKTCRSMCCRTTRLQSSFIPQSVWDSSIHQSTTEKTFFLCSIKGLQLARVPLQHRSGRMYWSGIFHKSLSSVVILTVPFENIWLDSHKSALLKICLFHSLKHIIDNEDGFLIGCWKKCTHLQYLLLKSGPNEFVMKRPALG